MNVTDNSITIHGLRRLSIILGNTLIIAFLISASGCKNNSGISEIGPPPTVRSTTPANNATDISISAPISARFNEQMNPQSISNNTFQLRNDTASVTGLVTYSDSTATFQPSSNLAYSSNYTASISGNVENLAGQTIPDTHEWSFSTIAAPPGPDVTPPRVVNRTPEVDGENISVNTTVQISFNEPINLETLNSNTFFVTSEESPVEGTVSYDNQVAIFDPDEPLDFATSYTATLDETVEDTAGNAMNKDVRWTFTTEAIPDTRPPSVTSTEPADG